VDFRKGMDGLAGVVKEHLRADPYSGAIFVFRAKRADRVKLIRNRCSAFNELLQSDIGMHVRLRRRKACADQRPTTISPD
jgi:hypothetical protein